ncbi:MAG: DUF3575 domain-containing protein [Flavobacteriales bacterium]
MKTQSFFVLVCTGLLLTTFNPLQAQLDSGEPQFKGTIKWNPLGIFAGQYQFGYEHMLNDRMSVQLMAGLVNQRTDQVYQNFVLEEQYRYEQLKSGFIAIPEFRYYVSPQDFGAPEGLFVSAFARILNLTYDLDDTADEGQWGDLSRMDERLVIGGGLVLGYGYYLDNGLMLEAFIGPQFKSVNFDRTYDNPDLDEETGDARFDEKFVDISLGNIDNDGGGVRFGINVGFAF